MAETTELKHETCPDSFGYCVAGSRKHSDIKPVLKSTVACFHADKFIMQDISNHVKDTLVAAIG